MDNLIHSSLGGREYRIVRFLIDNTAKSEILSYLRRMNISSATLFPDLIGLAESLSDWFYLPMHFVEDDLRLALNGECLDDRY